MKLVRFKVRNFNKIQTALILFFFGLFFGVLFANVFRTSYVQDLSALDLSYYKILKNIKLDYIELLKYTITNHLKSFMIFWILCITILGIPFIIGSVVAKGFEVGFLISAVTLQYGLKGILLFFAYLVPQIFLYVPVMIICLQKGFELAQHVYQGTRKPMTKSVVFEYLALLFMLLALIGIGAILETYIGSSILKKTLEIIC